MIAVLRHSIVLLPPGKITYTHTHTYTHTQTHTYTHTLIVDAFLSELNPDAMTGIRRFISYEAGCVLGRNAQGSIRGPGRRES